VTTPPTPLLALDVQRAGTPGQPGASVGRSFDIKDTRFGAGARHPDCAVYRRWPAFGALNAPTLDFV